MTATNDSVKPRRSKGRPRTCDCGECRKCKHRVYQARWWASLTDEQRQAYAARRDRAKMRVRDRVREQEDPRRRVLKRARDAVSHAIRDGRLERGACEVGDDCSGPIHAHHDDYSKPLDVRWLCKRHHDAFHASLPEG